MRRRDVVKLLGVGALAASAPRAWAQGREVVIGVLYPLSGPVAQAGVDAKAAAETAAEIVNTRQDLELPLARTEGLPGLGGARLRLIFVDHQGKPELGQSEAERLITQEKAVALYGAYHSSVSATASAGVRAPRRPVPLGRVVLAHAAPPRLQVVLPHQPARRALLDRDVRVPEGAAGQARSRRSPRSASSTRTRSSARTRRGSRSSSRRPSGYKVVEKMAYRARTTSMQTEVQRLKAANPDVLLPTSLHLRRDPASSRPRASSTTTRR